MTLLVVFMDNGHIVGELIMTERYDEIRLTVDQLVHAGKLLYGDHWQSELGRMLEIDTRRIRDWLQGRRPIPVGIRGEVIELLQKKSLDTAIYAKNLIDVASNKPA